MNWRRVRPATTPSSLNLDLIARPLTTIQTLPITAPPNHCLSCSTQTLPFAAPLIHGLSCSTQTLLSLLHPNTSFPAPPKHRFPLLHLIFHLSMLFPDIDKALRDSVYLPVLNSEHILNPV